jgi:hypothetical protein
VRVGRNARVRLQWWNHRRRRCGRRTDAAAKSDSETGKAHGAFGTCTEGAQDECPGWQSVASIAAAGGCLDKMWAEGPGTDYTAHGHYINMSNPKYTKVACGYYTTLAGKVWAVQNLR